MSKTSTEGTLKDPVFRFDVIAEYRRQVEEWEKTPAKELQAKTFVRAEIVAFLRQRMGRLMGIKQEDDIDLQEALRAILRGGGEPALQAAAEKVGRVRGRGKKQEPPQDTRSGRKYIETSVEELDPETGQVKGTKVIKLDITPQARHPSAVPMPDLEQGTLMNASASLAITERNVTRLVSTHKED